MAIEPLPNHREPLRHVSESLDRWRVLAGLGRTDLLGSVRDHWAQLVGPSLSRITEPEAVRRSRLVVATTVPAAATQLRWIERDLLAAIDQVCGTEDAVHGLDVVVRSPATGPSVDP